MRRTLYKLARILGDYEAPKRCAPAAARATIHRLKAKRRRTLAVVDLRGLG
jgi:hypothetical protein